MPEITVAGYFAGLLTSWTLSHFSYTIIIFFFITSMLVFSGFLNLRRSRRTISSLFIGRVTYSSSLSARGHVDVRRHQSHFLFLCVISLWLPLTYSVCFSVILSNISWQDCPLGGHCHGHSESVLSEVLHHCQQCPLSLTLVKLLKVRGDSHQSPSWHRPQIME